ncbi:MAG: ArsA family ATPase [Chloroflexi bacterium]|nr:ArsA family ATPase [Chloroflexota bacterium]
MGKIPPTFLTDTHNRLLLFGGKGGVGKTTLAATTALYWSEENKQRKVLIASTDPAHSLGDSFDQTIGDVITPIEKVPNLFALEMDASKRLENFKLKYDSILKIIMDRGTFFDQEDIGDFLNLSLPGMDELMAVLEIAQIVREKKFDLIILDTAPTGHTLRLLALPRLMDKWIHVLNLMLEKHRYMASTFGKYRPDETDAFLKMMKSDLGLLETLLTDPDTTEFIPVTIPESMSINETQKLLLGLRELKIRVRTVVVNRMVGKSNCDFCEGRRKEQEPFFKRLASQNPNMDLVQIPLFSNQVRGRESLHTLGQILLGASPPPPDRIESTPVMVETSPAHPYDTDALLKMRLILFGGKGGVGKTTVATATAIYLASVVDPSTPKKTLLFSTDPAHSLSDSLNQPIGNEITPIVGIPHLYAIEMNSSELLEELNRTYIEEINEVFNSFLNSAFSIEFDRQVMEEMISLTPPGIDELMALMKVMELMDSGQFDRYVLDLAPTGHALRFLETPTVVRQWFITFFKLLVKYQGIATLDKVEELLLEKSKQLRRVQKLLLDPEQCQFVTVTIPEAMAVSETSRLVARLTELKVPCHLVVTNMITPARDCPFCSKVHAQQQPYLEQIEKLLPWSIRLPLFPQAVGGTEKLLLVSKKMYGGKHG